MMVHRLCQRDARIAVEEGWWTTLRIVEAAASGWENYLLHAAEYEDYRVSMVVVR